MTAKDDNVMPSEQDETPEAATEQVAEPEGQQEAETETDQADLHSQLQEAREKEQEQYDKYVRLAAEFDNYKKRIQREQANRLKYAEENLLRELLPSLDNLERAIEQGSQTEDAGALLEGVEMTYNGLCSCLEKYGLTAVESVGQAFDPNFHEAMSMEASDSQPANTVLQEYQKGYMYKDRLLRAAKVVVSSGPAEAAEE